MPEDRPSGPDLFARLARLFEEGHAREIDVATDPFFAADAGDLRPAAVLIAVTDRAKPGVLLTHRPETMRAHAGQAAFPGGKIDPGEDAIDAALREAEEELAIDRAMVRVIGATDPLRTRTGYDITPVLAVVPPDLPLRPNPAEVASWFEPPLSFLLDTANHLPRSGELGGEIRSYTEIIWQGHRIWGVTAAIIANLSRRLTIQEAFGG